jgi:hypothetical protein
VIDEHQATSRSALRERVLRGEYQVDPLAVAEAIVRRLGQWALTAWPSESVVVPRKPVSRVGEDESRRAL